MIRLECHVLKETQGVLESMAANEGSEAGGDMDKMKWW